MLDIDPQSAHRRVNINDLTVELEHGTGNISATRSITDTPELQAYLKDTEAKLPENNEFEEELRAMYETVHLLLKSTKYLYGLYRLDPQSSMNFSFFWSLDTKNWYPIASRLKSVWVVGTNKQVLPDPLLSNFSICFSKGWEPFNAFEHLHQAFAERFNTRYQWINGAIAAEQGIKEFLSRIKPEIEVLLNELPSPPINKLYKSILKAYTGHESSYYKPLQNGAEIRNKLVHKASHPAPIYQETIVYLHAVECALIELNLLLDSESAFFKYLLETAQNRLKEVMSNPKSVFH